MAPLESTDISIEYLINHLFLPPKLPGTDDVTVQLQSNLLKFIGACIGKFAGGVHEQYHKEKWHRLLVMVEKMQSTRSGKDLSSEQLYSTMMNMEYNGMSGLLCKTFEVNFQLRFY
ncbi:MAG TPA: hypothetical protein VGO47_13345 [Chlamydiales bacterium]|nr:hypothetical protein [Chlamydiales bacterium]